MHPGMEIITADGKRIGHLGPCSRIDVLQIARSPHTIPVGWVARVDSDVILRKTYAQMVDAWGAEPGPVVIAGGRH